MHILLNNIVLPLSEGHHQKIEQNAGAPMDTSLSFIPWTPLLSHVSHKVLQDHSTMMKAPETRRKQKMASSTGRIRVETKWERQSN